MTMPFKSKAYEISLADYPRPSTANEEVQVLADFVENPDTIEEAQKNIEPWMFQDERRREAWSRLLNMQVVGKPVDLSTISAEIDQDTYSEILRAKTSTTLEAITHYSVLGNAARNRDAYDVALEVITGSSKNTKIDTEAIKARIDKLFTSTPSANWRDFRFNPNEEIVESEPLIRCGNSTIVTRENITVITGKPKACKTTFQSAMIASCLTGDQVLNMKACKPLSILLADTEQSKIHLSRQTDRIFRMGHLEKGDMILFDILALRPLSPTDRYNTLISAIEECRPDIVFIDGAADLISDTNDLQQSETLVANLLTVASKLNCGVVCVVHSNPSSDKIRGHLGSCFERKAETVILLERDGMDNNIRVRPKEARNRPFEAFSICLNELGDPENMPQKSRKRLKNYLLKQWTLTNSMGTLT